MLSNELAFEPEHDAEAFAAVPCAPAVFLLRSGDSEPYVSKTTNLQRRLTRLLAAAEEPARRLNLRKRVTHIEYTPTGSDFESSFLLYRTLRSISPLAYRKKLRLRFAPLIKFNLDNPYPRAYVTQRITALRGKTVYYGPFPTRAAAEQFLNDSLDLYQIRRCDFELHPDPAYPGCVYSEMKMCLAPCFKGCSDAEYHNEVQRVREFLDSGGQSLLRELSQQRERASQDLEFEMAAMLHGKIEKISATARLPEIVRRLDLLTGVIIQPAAAKDSVALFPVVQGCVSQPMLFPVQQGEGKPQSMESRFRQTWASAGLTPTASALQRMEHLAILKRWYYRSLKVGEIFLADTNGELPVRRITRGISRVFRGEKPETDAMQNAAREYWLARTRQET